MGAAALHPGQGGREKIRGKHGAHGVREACRGRAAVDHKWWRAQLPQGGGYNPTGRHRADGGVSHFRHAPHVVRSVKNEARGVIEPRAGPGRVYRAWGPAQARKRACGPCAGHLPDAVIAGVRYVHRASGVHLHASGNVELCQVGAGAVRRARNARARKRMNVASRRNLADGEVSRVRDV